MLAFCGYNMGDYINHWIGMGRRVTHPPKIFLVNWFRKGVDGKFVWPGYGENMRVLKWIVERVEGLADATRTPLGYLPGHKDLDWRGLDGFSPDRYKSISAIDYGAWRDELPMHKEFIDKLGDGVPGFMRERYQELASKLG
jgi:phosphoenolpyruvate carboxykinase (GTP)